MFLLIKGERPPFKITVTDGGGDDSGITQKIRRAARRAEGGLEIRVELALE